MSAQLTLQSCTRVRRPESDRQYAEFKATCCDTVPFASADGRIICVLPYLLQTLDVLFIKVSHGIKARTQAHAEIAHYRTWCLAGSRDHSAYSLVLSAPGREPCSVMNNFHMSLGSCYSLSIASEYTYMKKLFYIFRRWNCT